MSPSSSPEQEGAWVGRRVAKLFHVRNNSEEVAWYEGTVKEIWKKGRWTYYRIHYDDGEEEDLTRRQVRAILSPPADDETTKEEGNNQTTAPSATTPSSKRPPAAAATVVTQSPTKKLRSSSSSSTAATTNPGGSASRPRRLARRQLKSYDEGSDDDDDDDERMNDSRKTKVEEQEEEEEFGLNDMESEKEEDDVLMLEEEEDDDDDVVMLPKKKDEKKKPKATKRTNNNKTKKTTRKKNNKQTAVAAIPPNSVAARGLPQGSLAVKGGWAIRSLEGVAPLLTPAVVQTAQQLMLRGKVHEAARLCHNVDAHEVAAVVQEAARQLGISNKGKGSAANNNLSARAQRRLEEGLQPLTAELPGPLLVVQADSDLHEHVIDTKWESAAELHAELKTVPPFATYEMTVQSDDTFASWSVVRQRLQTAGFVPLDSDNNTEEDLSYFCRPYLVRVDWSGGDLLPKGSWQMYQPDASNDQEDFVWALLEGNARNAPPIVIGVPPSLLTVKTNAAASGGNEAMEVDSDSHMIVPPRNSSSGDLLPPLAPKTAQIRLPASQLEKSIRRSFCSPRPLLEACQSLLTTNDLSAATEDNTQRWMMRAPPGGTYAMLSTIWRCMLEDASPFAAPTDGSLLGLEELFLLTLVARVDEHWSLPSNLLRKAIATALRTQKQPANFRNIHNTGLNVSNNKGGSYDADRWQLSSERKPAPGRTAQMLQQERLLDVFMIMQAAEGEKIICRAWLDVADPATSQEIALIDRFEQGLLPSNSDQRIERLDTECRLAAFDLEISPNSLLLIQACLPEPPSAWKKHSVPALASHVLKLVTNANPRMPDHYILTRLAAWGNSNVVPQVPSEEAWRIKEPLSAREIVTSTGILSEKEGILVDCFEAVQSLQQKANNPGSTSRKCTSIAIGTQAEETRFKIIRTEVGSPPTEHDGRLAFILAFGMAEEIEVIPEGGCPEVVKVLFCGSEEEPLLVKREGKARKAVEQSNAPVHGLSGAKAVPSLGYVDRKRSKQEEKLYKAAERAVSDKWKDGKTVALPLPPPGFQWKLRGTMEGREEEAEKAVKLCARLDDDGKWCFTVNEVSVQAFDARNIIAPCSLDTDNHDPLPLDLQHRQLLSIVVYEKDNVEPEDLLSSLHELHAMAESKRNDGACEGNVYDWLPSVSRVSPHMWRDTILSIKTRERSDVILGPAHSDGKCKRDMTEGVLVRLFYALESLYPTALIKCGAFKWLVRPRGAGYHHMMSCLEQLSRGAILKLGSISRISSSSAMAIAENRTQEDTDVPSRSKRAKRAAAVAALHQLAKASESDPEVKDNESASVRSDGSEAHDSDSDLLDNDIALVTSDNGTQSVSVGEEYPTVKTKLWPHQQASVEKIVGGVMQGRRGHADASAVGAGKTLSALATITRLSLYAEKLHGTRNGVLVMLPTEALIKEWLLQIAEHTSGFHVIEQRANGQLFSLTYGKSNPPIDGCSIVLSTLDRVREHPFVRQAAWDFVVIDECLAVQNADAKRCPSAWQQIEMSALGVLMLSATFFRSKFSDLFYMIRMFRSPLPRSIEWLPATIHEHIVCQVPETDRTWKLQSEAVSLRPNDLKHYRSIIETYKRKQISGGQADFRRLFVDLEAFLRSRYEGRESDNSFGETSIMAEACHGVCERLLSRGRRPLVFADTSDEAEHFLNVLRRQGINACTWSELSSARVAGGPGSMEKGVIVAVKSVEGQGINMQGHADSIICRPTPGDHLEQMKGRIDRPGQMVKDLILVVLVAEHTLEEAKFSNIHLAGNFFRDYLAPIATKYRERIDLEATLAAGGTGTLKSGTVASAWRRSLESAGHSGMYFTVEYSALLNLLYAHNISC